ncbi:DeoR family transcriptional regulator, partial [Planctomycetota bacterium]
MPQQKEKIDVVERQLRIREQLKDNQEVSVPELAVMFNVSEMTVHRDLKRLEDDGRVRRTRGGAVAAERMEFEFDFAFRRK